MKTDVIPLRWVEDTEKWAKLVFGGGITKRELTYLGATIHADFELSYESLAPYVTKVLDLAAPLEGAGLTIKLIEIKGGEVKVW
jgi:hypothetical protein